MSAQECFPSAGLSETSLAIPCALLQIEGLGALERRWRVRWPDVREMLFREARESMSSSLTSERVIIAPDGLLIAFPHCRNESIVPKARELARELGEFLIVRHGGQLGVRLQVFATPAPHHASAEEFAEQGRPAEWLVDTIEWRFQPYWSRDKREAAASSIQPYERGQRVPLHGYTFDACINSPEYAVLDETSLRACEAALREHATGQRRGCVGAAIHMSSLIDVASRAHLTGIVARLDRKLRQRRFIKIAGVPANYSRLQLAEIVGSLKPYVASVAVATSCEDDDVPTLYRLGVSHVGFTLSRFEASQDGRPEADILGRAAQAVRAARYFDKSFFMDGAIGSDLAGKLIDAGVDYVASPNLWPPSRRPYTLARSGRDREAYPATSK